MASSPAHPPPRSAGGTHGSANSCHNGSPGPVSSTVTVSTSITTTLAVSADAVGSDTFSDITATVKMVDRGLLTFASGTVTAIAAASSSTGSSPYAQTTAMLDITGADLVVYSSSENTSTGSESSVTQSLSLDFLAIDVSWLTAAIMEGEQEVSVGPTSSSLSGNLASFSANLVAEGDNGFTDLAADAIAIEDLMSSSYLTASVGTAATTTFTQISGTRHADTIITNTASTIVRAGAGRDTIIARDGDDWIFAGDGHDSVTGGGGADTVFAGAGHDKVDGGSGNDWVFGGRGQDTIEGGSGNDLLFGDAGEDCLNGGAGNDLFSDGIGDDRVSGGAGSDVFRLGMARGDDDDVYTGGSGADAYWLVDRFDDDVVTDFRLAEGDRLVHSVGDWEGDAALRAHNGCDVFLSRGARDTSDLVITFNFDRYVSTLTLDHFFTLNSGFGLAPQRGTFNDTQALSLLRAIFGDDFDVLANADHQLFIVGDFISDLG